MYIYIFVYIYTCTYTHIHMYKHACIYVYIYIHIFTYTYLHIFTHIHIFTYVYLHTYTHTTMHIYTYIHIAHTQQLWGGYDQQSLKIIGLFCRISPLLQGSFAKETYNFKEPTNRSHPIARETIFSRHFVRSFAHPSLDAPRSHA